MLQINCIKNVRDKDWDRVIQIPEQFGFDQNLNMDTSSNSDINSDKGEDEEEIGHMKYLIVYQQGECMENAIHLAVKSRDFT